ncbi:hypothetical protein P148_SR1C00001G0807 [candidate division SR1 bacterium RAAC1_SR1_1]|nr:hypothetical protein P148_SR1C00001G0807 [candidate division SR1 bacterium RAAC1_SR1_1]
MYIRYIDEIISIIYIVGGLILSMGESENPENQRVAKNKN